MEFSWRTGREQLQTLICSVLPQLYILRNYQSTTLFLSLIELNRKSNKLNVSKTSSESQIESKARYGTCHLRCKATNTDIVILRLQRDKERKF